MISFKIIGLAPPDREVFWVCFPSSTFVARTTLKEKKNHSKLCSFRGSALGARVILELVPRSVLRC